MYPILFRVYYFYFIVIVVVAAAAASLLNIPFCHIPQCNSARIHNILYALQLPTYIPSPEAHNKYKHEQDA